MTQITREPPKWLVTSIAAFFPPDSWNGLQGFMFRFFFKLLKRLIQLLATQRVNIFSFLARARVPLTTLSPKHQVLK